MSSSGTGMAAAEEGFDPAWLELEKALGGRKFLQGGIAQRRVQFNGMMDLLGKQWPAVEGVEVSDQKIIRLTGGAESASPAGEDAPPPEVAVRVYRPKQQQEGKPLPVGLWLHGGGWHSGTLDSEDPQCRQVAKDVPCLVVSVDYGLVPDYMASEQLEDCFVAYEWTRKRAADFGGDPNNMFLIGGSAGGALALSLTHRLAREGRAMEIRGCVALYPVTVHPHKLPKKYEHLYKSFFESEMTSPVVRGPDLVSALDLTGIFEQNKLFVVQFMYDDEAIKSFPPTYIATAGKDLLRDDGVILDAALTEVGIPVARDHYEGLPHYFWVFPQLEKSQLFMRQLNEGIRWVVGQVKKEGLVVHGI